MMSLAQRCLRARQKRLCEIEIIECEPETHRKTTKGTCPEADITLPLVTSFSVSNPCNVCMQ